MLWDVFCKVIDNHGDIGVCWRLSAELAARGESVRLWVDDPSALGWMAPQGHRNVRVIPWTASTPVPEPGDVVIEAFGCSPPDAFIAALKARSLDQSRQPPWINLEYLSAEPWVERSHGLQSPVLSGPGQGLTKHFFFPGFTRATGGLLREADYDRRRRAFDRAAWLDRQGIRPDADSLLVSLFCYEPPALDEFFTRLADSGRPIKVLVTPGRALAAVKSLAPDLQGRGALTFHALPYLTQNGYDELLWSCDLNFVRGEDSLVRALWAGKPCVWQAYPQDDGVHGAKVRAWLDWQEAPADLRQFHLVWNGLSDERLPPVQPTAWAGMAELAMTRACSNPELTDALMHHVSRVATI